MTRNLLKSTALAAVAAIAIGMAGVSAQASDRTFLPQTEAATKHANANTAYDARWAEIDARYGPALADIDQRVEKAQAAGIPLDTLIYVWKDRAYRILDARDLISDERNLERTALNARHETIRENIDATAQKELEDGKDVQTAVEILTLPGQLAGNIIGRPEIAQIDTYEWRAGRPFGDKGAFIPKARNDVGKLVGVNLNKDNGVIGNAVKNPLQPWKW
jgi:hypothetical protein